MIPQKFPAANVEMVKPENWKDEDCNTIPVWHGIIQLPSGAKCPAFTSAWKPTAEELEELNNGGMLYLTMLSTTLPPVSLETKDPFLKLEVNGDAETLN